jgi:UPF0176 protein
MPRICDSDSAKDHTMSSTPGIVVSAMYLFVTLDDYEALRAPLLKLMRDNAIKGTILLAHEGINGTVAGPRQGIDVLLAWLKQDSRLAALSHKESYSDETPFLRARVKLKQEIVTMGQPDIDPTLIVGTYVKPRDWDALIADADVTLIDTRNDYEVQIGSFANAVNPNTASFREFPRYVKENLDPARHKKVAMYCTGGIRCEKSTAYLKQMGFEQVYHLEGGILKYLEEIPETESSWRGECFVFDNRVAVNHQLQQGSYDQCHACRMPITAQDQLSEHYVEGISCHHCYDKTSARRRQRFAQRQKQMQLARCRGEAHLGDGVVDANSARRRQKLCQKNAQRQVR